MYYANPASSRWIYKFKTGAHTQYWYFWRDNWQLVRWQISQLALSVVPGVASLLPHAAWVLTAGFRLMMLRCLSAAANHRATSGCRSLPTLLTSCQTAHSVINTQTQTPFQRRTSALSCISQSGPNCLLENLYRLPQLHWRWDICPSWHTSNCWTTEVTLLHTYRHIWPFLSFTSVVLWTSLWKPVQITGVAYERLDNQPTVTNMQQQQLSIEAHTGTPPAADWKRQPGHPRRNWLQQV